MNIPYNDSRIAGDFLLSAGQYGPKSTGPKVTIDYITCTAATRIDVLEEFINGVSTNVLTDHGMIVGSIPGLGYVIKSKYGHGFSRITIGGVGNTSAFVLNSQLESNDKDSVESGINKIG
jgi:hypothetical protein